jgi:predicted alpha/beta hydrolase family esterase
MTVFIIHGAYGHPGENWFPWLQTELDKLDVEVILPKFPTPKGQSLQAWLEIIDDYKIHKDDILVGHSIGSAFVLRLLEKYKVKAAFLVAGFLGRLNSEEVDEINHSFFEKPFNWQKIKNNCKNIFIINSDNDPYVPLDKAEQIAEKLNVAAIIVKGAGHFNKAAGYLRFDMLLKELKKFI